MDHGGSGGGGGGVNGLSNLVSATVWPLLPPRPALDGRVGKEVGGPSSLSSVTFPTHRPR